MSEITIQGIEGVVGEIKKLTSDKMKRLEIIKILRTQVKPILAAIKANTPVADEDIVYRKNNMSSDNNNRANDVAEILAYTK